MKIWKTCCECKQNKPVVEFYRHKKTLDGLQSQCKECGRARQQARSPEEKRRKHRQDVTRRCGLRDQEHYLQVLESQKGVCAICQEPMKVPQIDHNHDSGKFRGLLCVRCNTGLGKFKDSPGLIQKALSYLLDSLG